MPICMREAFTPEEKRRYKPKRVYHESRKGTTPTRSTFRYVDEQGRKIIRYHYTDIYIEHQDTFIIRNGGWITPSTKERLNTFIPYGYISQKDYTWYFNCKGVVIPFEDGMKLPLSEVEFINKHVPYGHFADRQHFEYNGVKAVISDISELPAKPEVFEVQYAYNPAYCQQNFLFRGNRKCNVSVLPAKLPVPREQEV